jgi:hypothetical protein
MPKKRAKNGEEFWRGRVRELEKENRSLKKRIKQIQKKEHIFDDSNSQDTEVAIDSEDTYPDLKRLNPCNECGKGFIEEYEIMGKVIGTCNICGDRKRIK